MKEYKDVNPDNLIVRDLLALDRTRLANERTFLAYLRTFFAFAAGAFTLIKFGDTAFLTLLGSVGIGIAICIFLYGTYRFLQVQQKLDELKEDPDSHSTHANVVQKLLYLVTHHN